jgi:hypothetical protein
MYDEFSVSRWFVYQNLLEGQLFDPSPFGFPILILLLSCGSMPTELERLLRRITTDLIASIKGGERYGYILDTVSSGWNHRSPLAV